MKAPDLITYACLHASERLIIRLLGNKCTIGLFCLNLLIHSFACIRRKLTLKKMKTLIGRCFVICVIEKNLLLV